MARYVPVNRLRAPARGLFAGFGEVVRGIAAGPRPSRPIFTGFGDLGANYDAYDPAAFTALVNAIIAGNYGEVWRIVANHNEGYSAGGGDVSAAIQQAYASDPIAQEWFRNALQQAKSGQLVDPPFPKVENLAAALKAQQDAANAAAVAAAPTYAAPSQASSPSYSSSPSPTPSYSAPAPAPAPTPTYQAPAPYYPPAAVPYTGPPSTPASLVRPAPVTSGQPQPPPAPSGDIDVPGIGPVPLWGVAGVGAALLYLAYRKLGRRAAA